MLNSTQVNGHIEFVPVIESDQLVTIIEPENKNLDSSTQNGHKKQNYAALDESKIGLIDDLEAINRTNISE
jgi:hypothetical protein